MSIESNLDVPGISMPLTDEMVRGWEEYAAGAYDRELAQVEEVRRQAYIRDADPLFFGYQRGENTEQDWLDAVQAVKDANPYPEAE
jgi:hypothetical protein